MPVHAVREGIEMTDEAPVQPRTVRFGPDDIKVTDPANIQPVSAEAMTELRFHNGVFAISLASIVLDGTGPAELRVCARLRIGREVLADLQAAIQGQLDRLEQAKQSAN